MKFNRFVAVVVILVSIAGNAGLASVASAAPRAQPPRARQRQLIGSPALTIPPASSLGVQFVQVATAANAGGNATTIDYPLTTDNPDTIILVTPNWNPGGVGGQYNNHPIRVQYNSGPWQIVNQDLANIPIGAAFNVISPTIGANAFVYTATSVSGDHAFINSPLLNGHPNAILFVTLNYAPGGNCPCVFDAHPTGVEYIGGQWAIVNEDGASMPLNASFNVFIPPAGPGTFVQTATAANGADVSARIFIDNALTNGNPNALVFVTPNGSPGGAGATLNPHNIAVSYIAGHWGIFNQDLAHMPAGMSFNVLVLVPALDAFIHTASASNSVAHITKIDDALTNGHPNAIALTTPNLSAAGLSTPFDPSPTGLYYYQSQWTIFNEDAVTMPVGAAFNVIVPASGANVFVDLARTVASDYTILDNPLTNGNPNAIVFATPNWNPGGVGGVTDNNPIGVYYTNGHWTIFNESGVNMPHNAGFNVFIPRPGANVFVHTATVGSLFTLNSTIIDNPMTNGNPNAILVVTPNYNPGGVGGTYDNYPIGVFYVSGHWLIVNQNAGTMPLGAAFNVLVYNKLYLPVLVR